MKQAPLAGDARLVHVAINRLRLRMLTPGKPRGLTNNVWVARIEKAR